MKNLTPELIEKAKSVNSAEELLALAKENNLEIAAEEANTYFEQLNANGELSDDALDAVAGGGIFGCGDDEKEANVNENEDVKTVILDKCQCCGAPIYPGVKQCPSCKRVLSLRLS